jgi:hypothetical protein
MKRRWLSFAILLCSCSAAIYLFWFALFGDMHEIGVWFLGNLAFLPLQVLLVTLVLEQVMAARERAERLDKLNVVIGAFYSELGRELLTDFSHLDIKMASMKKSLVFKVGWSGDDYRRLVEQLKAHEYSIEIESADLNKLKERLLQKRDFMLRMMEIPNLLEHETFTDLLRAIFHVTEELEARKDFSLLPKSDMAHLRSDINRSYKLLVIEWLAYMRYMSKEYPYLFHLAVRQNPFDENADVIVK